MVASNSIRLYGDARRWEVAKPFANNPETDYLVASTRSTLFNYRPGPALGTRMVRSTTPHASARTSFMRAGSSSDLSVPLFRDRSERVGPLMGG